jgi:hypothetical protein
VVSDVHVIGALADPRLDFEYSCHAVKKIGGTWERRMDLVDDFSPYSFGCFPYYTHKYFVLLGWMDVLKLR